MVIREDMPGPKLGATRACRGLVRVADGNDLQEILQSTVPLRVFSGDIPAANQSNTGRFHSLSFPLSYSSSNALLALYTVSSCSLLGIAARVQPLLVPS